MSITDRHLIFDPNNIRILKHGEGKELLALCLAVFYILLFLFVTFVIVYFYRRKKK